MRLDVCLSPVGDAALLRCTSTYWSPRFPHRVNKIDFGDLCLIYSSGRLFVFTLRDEHVLWLWGSDSAVRTRFPVAQFFDLVGGAVLVTVVASTVAGGLSRLYLVPLPVDVDDCAAALPTRVPYLSAPFVAPVELHSTRELLTIKSPRGSDTHAPLVMEVRTSTVLALYSIANDR